MKSVLVLNGPNLNLLGHREPDVYGHDTLADVEALCHATGKTLGLTVVFKQSNHEGELIDALHACVGRHHGAILNGAGLTHTSVSLRDAVAGIDIPVIELHLTNIHSREDFRAHSYTAPMAVGIIAGFGKYGYELALRAMNERLQAS